MKYFGSLRLSAETQGRIEQLVQAHLGQTFPALAVVAIQGGQVRLNAAAGVVNPESDNPRPVAEDSLFDLASVSKLFTMTAFLSLVSDGKVGLDDPLVSVLRSFSATGPRPIDGGQDPHSKVMLPIPPETEGKRVDPTQVTFRQLLTHSSGLAPWRSVYNEAGPAPVPPDQSDPIHRTVRWAHAMIALTMYSFVDQPGVSVRYSDLGFMLLGDVIERLQIMPITELTAVVALDSVIQERVLDPLGLKDVLYNPVRNGRDRENIAPTEDDPNWRGRRPWGEVHDENANGVGGVAGHAGLFGTARDVAMLGQAWLTNDARLGISGELMDEARREQIYTASNNERRGLGWNLRTERDSLAGDVFSMASYGHTGFTGTSLWIDPTRELVVACLTNRVYYGRAQGTDG
ncbi:MAG: beta-lactamase family protein, partial [Burkholderiales bacterium]|nr:beta-lactamase family protein [Anaerolineae bacterium]